MSETKFDTVDGYALVDIEGASRLIGPARRAKKVLQRTTLDLVRHATYTAAFHGVQASGAAVALNLDPAADDQSPMATFADTAASWAEANHFSAVALLGLGVKDIAAITHDSVVQSQELIAASAAASAGDLAGKRISIVSEWDEAALTDRLSGASDVTAVPLAEALSSEADIVFVRGKTGVINHEVVDATNVGMIVGLQSLTFTARGLAVASRAGAVVVPDFVSAAGPVLAALGDEADAKKRAEAVATTVQTAIAPHHEAGTELFIKAAESAETFMRTWTDQLPFGRPLAP